jgi:hypothetical protein
MELADAIKRLIPLQVRLPDPKHPLQLEPGAVAEVFLVDTVQGPAVVWLDPFWCDAANGTSGHSGHCHIAYASPVGQPMDERWSDHDPAFGPHCIPWQKPFIIERLHPDPASPAWRTYKAWQQRRSADSRACGRRAAWERVQRRFGPLIRQRVV